MNKNETLMKYILETGIEVKRKKLQPMSYIIPPKWIQICVYKSMEFVLKELMDLAKKKVLNISPISLNDW